MDLAIALSLKHKADRFFFLIFLAVFFFVVVFSGAEGFVVFLCGCEQTGKYTEVITEKPRRFESFLQGAGCP